MANWFDSHCHLYEFDDPTAAIHDARAAGIAGMVTLGTDESSSARGIELAHRHDGVWAGAAVHPSEAKGWRPERADEIAALLADPEVVAVGETGLDFYWDTTFVDDQTRAFHAHIALAKEHDKALVIHTRASVGAAIAALARTGPPERLVFHCWSGDAERLDRALALGAYISFAGNVTFKNADDLRALARAVPADRLLVETDAPYLSPEPRRGKRNAPANVALVGSAVARARGDDPDTLAEATTNNARALFAIDTR